MRGFGKADPLPVLQEAGTPAFSKHTLVDRQFQQTGNTRPYGLSLRIRCQESLVARVQPRRGSPDFSVISATGSREQPQCDTAPTQALTRPVACWATSRHDQLRGCWCATRTDRRWRPPGPAALSAYRDRAASVIRISDLPGCPGHPGMQRRLVRGAGDSRSRAPLGSMHNRQAPAARLGVEQVEHVPTYAIRCSLVGLDRRGHLFPSGRFDLFQYMAQCLQCVVRA
jgi:hypothetical protein